MRVNVQLAETTGHLRSFGGMAAKPVMRVNS
jgi:hypothetical protein